MRHVDMSKAVHLFDLWTSIMRSWPRVTQEDRAELAREAASIAQYVDEAGVPSLAECIRREGLSYTALGSC